MASDKNAKKDDKAPEEGAEGAAAEGEQPRKRFSGKKLVLFIILPAVLLLGGAAGAHFTGMTKKLLGGGVEKAEEHKPEAPKQAIYYNLPEMLVNLNSAGRRASYLKISVSLELENPADIPRIEAIMPRIVDNFQVYLRELRIEDLKGSAGLYRLREELLARVNTAAQPARVNDVLFKEMLVQ
jgi:flagellar FliL protein